MKMKITVEINNERGEFSTLKDAKHFIMEQRVKAYNEKYPVGTFIIQYEPDPDCINSMKDVKSYIHYVPPKKHINLFPEGSITVAEFFDGTITREYNHSIYLFFPYKVAKYPSLNELKKGCKMLRINKRLLNAFIIELEREGIKKGEAIILR